MEIPIEGCKAAYAYRESHSKKYILLSLLIALYAVVLPYCYYTAGEPRYHAMLNAQRIADEKWLKESTGNHVAAASNASNTTIKSSTTIEANSIIADSSDSIGKSSKDSSEDNDETFTETTKSSQPFFYSWFTESKESKRAKKELKELKKSFATLTNEEGNPISLPPSYLPSAWACLALFSLLTLHILFHLLCHWLVFFKASMLFTATNTVNESTVLLIVPTINRGKPSFTHVRKSTITNQYQLEFQRQTYIYTPSVKLGKNSKKYPNGVLTLTASPISLPISQYVNASGLRNETEINAMTEKFGKNHLAVPIPSFLDLFGQQLVSPLTMFQIFCAVLWLLDEYWTYTLWTLVSVLIFEATTVFQRSRTQSMLTSMAPKATPIYIYRGHKWQLLTTKDILPSDIISLSIFRGNQSGSSSSVNPSTSPTGPFRGTDIVPCDCLILRGSAVVNEASLTGESVPQMKEAITVDSSTVITQSSLSSSGAVSGGPVDVNGTVEGEDNLDMNGSHRVNTLFSGTTLVSIDSKINHHEKMSASLPNITSYAPDRGLVVYVLRTGFNSSQGTLLQMIEFSQQSVSGDAVEVGLALLLLFIFALIAAGYVLSEGLRKKEKTTHELLLKCVMIITSVVPRQLPMQMAMAVNMALMTLTKQGIFCTEPHRVPIGGKISHCLFDKTGTLTTDQLVPVGIIDATTPVKSSDSSQYMKKVSDASNETEMILAACHSLVVIDENTNQPDEDMETDPTDPASTAAESKADGNRQVITKQPSLSGKKLSIVGDPIESAALEGVEWTWDGITSTASPGNYSELQKKLDFVELKIREVYQATTSRSQPMTPQEISLKEKELEILRANAKVLQDKIIQAKAKASKALYQQVHVIQRYHFSSKLQRMSVLAHCLHPSSSSDASDLYAFVKGSPEAIKTLLIPDRIPSWYTTQYESMARDGLRVLALAYRRFQYEDIPQEYLSHISVSKNIKANNWKQYLKDFVKELPRSLVESKLEFGGFIAFECKIRGDSKIVIQSLKESHHKVMMVTGDSLLTSLHVAKSVGISAVDNKRSAAVLTTVTDGSTKKFSWSILHDDGTKTVIPFVMDQVVKMTGQYSLLTTESDLLALAEATGGKLSNIWSFIDVFEVFARMSPHGKATIIRALQQGNINDTDAMMTESSSHGTKDAVTNKKGNSSETSNHSPHKKDVFVLMCGDGGNDVGALKQADIGLALLSGHANANTTEEVSSSSATAQAVATPAAASPVPPSDAAKSSEDALNQHQKRLEARAAEINAKRIAHMKVFQVKYQAQQQERLQEEIRKLTEKGEYMSMFGLMKQQAFETKRAMDAENARFMAAHGQVWDPSKDSDANTGGLDSILGGLDTTDTGGLPMIRPGDASVAAPFTSRVPSIRAVVDLIRQGRCTLLSALMQQQIMMLESTITAFTMSALSLHNARSSERQMMASSWLIMTAAVSFSYASPLDHMHPIRPLKSLFHPAIIFSILGQAIIHIGCMTLAVRWATDAMGPTKLQEVTEFFRKVKAHEIDRTEHCGEDDLMCQLNSFWMAPFLPNLLNSVVFLVETSQVISVFFTNYKGRPWMKGMLENHPLFLSVFLCIAGVIVCAWEFVPQVNELIQLAPFPDDVFRYKVLFLVISTIFGTLLWDRLCVAVFARDISKASIDEFKKLSFRDFLPVLKTAGLVVIVVLLLGTGNLLILGVGYWYYRQYYAKPTVSVAQTVPMAGRR